MRIRFAQKKDIPSLLRLLSQVLEVHHKARPDLFVTGAVKYTDEELKQLLQEPDRPIFVAEEKGEILGYAFAVLSTPVASHVFTPIKTLYVDDLCVDEKARGSGVGRALYEHLCFYAKEKGCYHLTLNVWRGNESAEAFYEKMGLTPQKITMEKIL